MRNGISLTNTGKSDIKDISTLDGILQSPNYYPENDTLEANPDSEDHEILLSYTRRLGFSVNSDIIALSSTGHYFYDAEEMKNIKAVTNLKDLNQTKNLKGFFKSLYATLQPKTFFIGYFIDSSQASGFPGNYKSLAEYEVRTSEDIENGIRSRSTFMNMIYNLLDAKSLSSLSARTIELFMDNSGFRLIDVSTINGITCFCAQREPAVK